jgi:hypothetical protein
MQQPKRGKQRKPANSETLFLKMVSSVSLVDDKPVNTTRKSLNTDEI